MSEVDNMVVKNEEIRCPKCGNVIATQKSLMHYVIPDGGMKCPDCGTVVVQKGNATW